MSYSSRHRYKSMREKNKLFIGRLKMFIIAVIIAAIFYVIFNRVWLWDLVRTQFYD